MKLLHGAYRAMGSGLFFLLFPPFLGYTRISGRYRSNLKERLGILSPEVVKKLSGRPRIWIHAVSLGEVKVASSIIRELKAMRPECAFFVSTVTEHGRNMAGDILDPGIAVAYAPIDVVGPVRKALSTVKPHVMVYLETEIWPTWVAEARRRLVGTALINGRISVRSIGGYLKFRGFFQEVLKNFDVFSMISLEDGLRIQAMGADPQRVEINGNAKFDLPGSSADPGVRAEMRHALNLGDEQKVFVAGSTREGEEALVLEAYERILEKHPGTVLILAPRHIDRTAAVELLIEKRGLSFQRRTDLRKGSKRTAPVVIMDTFGELFKVYSIGTIVFCGASLVPLGGQNPLEPAAWGKVVLYGPSMEDFLDAKAVLESVGAGVPVSDADTLAEKAVRLLDRPEELRERGERGREAVSKNRGAARRHAEVIDRLLREILGGGNPPLPPFAKGG